MNNATYLKSEAGRLGYFRVAEPIEPDMILRCNSKSRAADRIAEIARFGPRSELIFINGVAWAVVSVDVDGDDLTIGLKMTGRVENQEGT